jgi:hypothetical protein
MALLLALGFGSLARAETDDWDAEIDSDVVDTDDTDTDSVDSDAADTDTDSDTDGDTDSEDTDDEGDGLTAADLAGEEGGPSQCGCNQASAGGAAMGLLVLGAVSSRVRPRKSRRAGS